MIIDLILDRKDNAEFYGVDNYNAEDFYRECMEYNSIFEGVADEIIDAMDYQTEEEIKQALCNYVINNGYNEKICDYINTVNWLD